MDGHNLLKEVFKNRTIDNVKILVKWLFPNLKAAQYITDKQANIVKVIAFGEHKRINISAYTRYGKSQMVAIAVAIYILINENKKIKFIGPTSDQAQIIKNYMSELILCARGNLLLDLSDINVRTKKERIKSEASQNRMTFKNGCEYKIVTAFGKGFGAMGFGGNLCFPKGTLIMTNKGLIDIEELVFKKLDYEILSFNHESNKFEFKKINYWFDNGDSDLVKVVHSKGFFRCSPNHPVFTDKGYVSAKDLCVNDKIYILNDFGKGYCKDKQCGFKSCYSLYELSFKDKFQQGLLEEVVVRKVEFLKNKERVYNLEVEDNNNYFADGILVHNCIMDEAAMVNRGSYAKIMRMLGDDVKDAIFVELYNPWDRDTKAFDHSINPRYYRIRIDYKVGIKEGRTTEDYINEMREEVTPLEFTVLYESRFPDEAEDSLHNLARLNLAENTSFNFLEEIKPILADLKDKHKMQESKYTKLKKEAERYEFRISCDPADKGLDFTTMFWGIVKDNKYYELYGIWNEPKSESMQIVSKIMQKVKEFIPKECKGSIHIDKIGIGTGAESRLREIKNEKGLDNIKVVGCHYGERAIKDKEFMNKKAENNFRCRDLFIENQISLSKVKECKDYTKLKNELMAMKWELTSSGKKRIIDPEKSPDFNDSMVYFVWKGKELIAQFL